MEIERKYLVTSQWRKPVNGSFYRQGYLSMVKERVVRVRTIDDKGYLTVKGITVGISRSEFEYPIPFTDANEMLDSLCERPVIEKHRYQINAKGFTWEVDEFHGENQGLILAEVELKDEKQKIELPNWIGKEVSDNPRYFNSNLITHPYISWDSRYL